MEEDIERDYMKEKAYIQAELDFHNDEEFGELFRKKAKIVIIKEIKQEEVGKFKIL